MVVLSRREVSLSLHVTESEVPPYVTGCPLSSDGHKLSIPSGLGSDANAPRASKLLRAGEEEEKAAQLLSQAPLPFFASRVLGPDADV